MQLEENQTDGPRMFAIALDEVDLVLNTDRSACLRRNMDLPVFHQLAKHPEL